MQNITVLLGSNIGDRSAQLDFAKEQVNKFLGEIHQQGPILETESWPDPTGTPFLNQLLNLSTALSPVQAIRNIMSIEKSMGRVRSIPNAPRTIDIDILEWGDLVYHSPILTLPHPGLHCRDYLIELYKNWNS